MADRSHVKTLEQARRGERGESPTSPYLVFLAENYPRRSVFKPLKYLLEATSRIESEYTVFKTGALARLSYALAGGRLKSGNVLTPESEEPDQTVGFFSRRIATFKAFSPGHLLVAAEPRAVQTDEPRLIKFWSLGHESNVRPPDPHSVSGATYGCACVLVSRKNSRFHRHFLLHLT
jgi:hypothetical protein